MKKNPPAVGPRGDVRSDLENRSVHRAADPHKQRSVGLSSDGPYGVPERWWRALRTGEGLAAGYAGVGSLLGAFVAADVPESVIYDVMLRAEHVGSAFFHTSSKGRLRGYGEASGMLRRALASKRRWMANGRHDGDRADAIAYAASVADEASNHPEAWRGQGGATDATVLVAVVGIAQRAGRWEFHASVRTVADEAGVGIATASRSLRRLVAGGWLRRQHIGKGEAASLYRLAVPAARRSGVGSTWNTQPVPTGTTTSVPPSSLPLDVWRWGGGLGKAAHRTWAMLGDEAVRAVVLAEATGITPRAVRNHLATLARYGLASRTATGWLRGEADPEAVGAMLAVAGAGERQRERHRVDREQRAEYLRRGRRRRRTWVEAGHVHTDIPLPDGGSVHIIVPIANAAAIALPGDVATA